MSRSRRLITRLHTAGIVALTAAACLDACGPVGDTVDANTLGRDSSTARDAIADNGVITRSDMGTTPAPDTGITPRPDSGTPPVVDAGTPPAGTLCGACTTSADCGSGNLCLTVRATGQQFCGQACGAGGSCPGTYTCTSIASGTGTVMQCVPSSGTCGVVPMGCTPACSTGQTCTAGRCVSAGTDAGTPPRPDAGTVPSSIDDQMLAAINAARATARVCTEPGMTGSFAAVPPLRWSPLLAMSATRESTDMAAHNMLSHTGTDGSTPFTRISATGYVYSAAGENIAAGQPTVAAVMSAWLGDYGHCANIMSPNYTEVGTSLVMSSSGYRYFWTQDFGRPR